MQIGLPSCGAVNYRKNPQRELHEEFREKTVKIGPGSKTGSREQMYFHNKDL